MKVNKKEIADEANPTKKKRICSARSVPVPMHADEVTERNDV